MNLNCNQKKELCKTRTAIRQYFQKNGCAYKKNNIYLLLTTKKGVKLGIVPKL